MSRPARPQVLSFSEMPESASDMRPSLVGKPAKRTTLTPCLPTCATSTLALWLPISTAVALLAIGEMPCHVVGNDLLQGQLLSRTKRFCEVRQAVPLHLKGRLIDRQHALLGLGPQRLGTRQVFDVGLAIPSNQLLDATGNPIKATPGLEEIGFFKILAQRRELAGLLVQQLDA